MTITLHLTPEIEARVRARAARLSQPVEEYLLGLAVRDASEPVTDALSPTSPRGAASEWQELIRRVQTGHRPGPEEQERAYRELVRGIRTGVTLTDEELRREAIYEDRSRFGSRFSMATGSIGSARGKLKIRE